jgi:transposase
MDQRIAFVAACLRDEAPMSVLCEAVGISRKTGYKWLARYRAHGPEGLHERCRAPHRQGRRMAPELAQAILALRRDRPHWGPRKLRAIVQLCRNVIGPQCHPCFRSLKMLWNPEVGGSRETKRREPSVWRKPEASDQTRSPTAILVRRSLLSV